MAIQFNSYRTSFKLANPKKTAAWIEKVARTEKSRIGSLSYVFCTDKYLLGINQQYLNHDTLTDIITFDYSEPAAKSIEGEIFISVQRVRENAKKMETDFSTELHRVIIHGVLHLIGYGDKRVEEKKQMRKKEDKYLNGL